MTSDTEANAKAAIKQLGYDTKYGKGVDDGNRNIKVQVEVDEANVNDLFGLGLTYVARIVPKYKMSLVYDYLQIDEDLNESRKKTEPLLLIANTKKIKRGLGGKTRANRTTAKNTLAKWHNHFKDTKK